MPNFHDTGWDPVEHIHKVTGQLQELTEAHNRLASAYFKLQSQVLEQQKIISELCLRISRPPQS